MVRVQGRMVRSSAFEGYQYNFRTNVFTVFFHDKTVGKYKNVPAWIFAAIEKIAEARDAGDMDASVGKYWIKEIKGKFEYVKVDSNA